MIIIAIAIFVVAGLVWAAEHTEKGRELFNLALAVRIKSRGNLKLARRMIRRALLNMGYGQAGAISVETVVYVFVAILIIYQLIPNISNYNTTVQSTANVSTMSKFAAGLGEWLFPLFGILALVFLLWQRRGGKSKI